MSSTTLSSGNLEGALLVRSTLDSYGVTPIAWRGDSLPALLAMGAVLLGGDLQQGE
jgi:hypothetical protein